MDTGATSGVAAKHDTKAMEDTGQPSAKVFMLPDKSKIRATRKMLMKNKLREGAREMNIVPGLHSALVSIPKFANADYIAVFDKNKANIYDAKTTTITSSADPVIIAPQCKTTGLWKLNLDADTEVTQKGISAQPTNKTVNAILDLPNNRQTMLYYHALVGYPTKETFLDTVRAGNYATWPGLITALLNKHFLDSDKTQKGHMKRQHQGVQSPRHKALEHILAREQQIKSNRGQKTHQRKSSDMTTFSSRSWTLPTPSTQTKQELSHSPCNAATGISWSSQNTTTIIVLYRRRSFTPTVCRYHCHHHPPPWMLPSPPLSAAAIFCSTAFIIVLLCHRRGIFVVRQSSHHPPPLL
jgi:hypothetical protein